MAPESKNTLSDTLDRIHLFSSLSDEERDRIGKAAERREVRSQEPLIDEGKHPIGLFLLQSGRVEVQKQLPDGSFKSLAKLTAPSFFGEMSFVTGQKTSARVVALEPTVCYLIHKIDFDRMLAANSLAAYKIVAAVAHVLAGRLKAMDEELVRLTSENGGSSSDHYNRLKSRLFES